MVKKNINLLLFANSLANLSHLLRISTIIQTMLKLHTDNNLMKNINHNIKNLIILVYINLNAIIVINLVKLTKISK